MTGAVRSLNLFSISPVAPFLETLADAIATGRLLPEVALDPADPLAASDLTVLLPTRRACRAFREVLLDRSGGQAAILPRIRPIGDVDEEALGFADSEMAAALEVPAAMPALSRHLLLTRLVLKWREEVGRLMALPFGEDRLDIPTSVADAVKLAGDLASLLDGIETEGGRLAAIHDLVPDEHTDYYRLTLEFLRILTEWWPDVLDERGEVDPARRRNLLIDAEAARIAAAGGQGPVIAAGSTGSIPASARLLTAIAAHPNGALVLPGLDLGLDGAAFGAVLAGDHVSHPQYGMAQLLARMGAGRDDVVELGTPAGARADRVTVLSEAFRPASTTDAWAGLGERLTPGAVRAAMAGARLVVADNEREEALTIALALREAVAQPRRTAALVTPDRELAGRVGAELRRWGLVVDDSAGTPLSRTMPGVFARLILDALEARLAPVETLALMKHPLFRLGRPPGVARRLARRLELAVYRGPRPAAGTAGLIAAVDGGDPDLVAFAGELAAALAPLDVLFGGGDALSLADLVSAHWATLSALAVDDAGTNLAAVGDSGEMLADYVAGLVDAERDVSGGAVRLSAADYPPAFAAFMAGRTVRPRGPAHPRLRILGLLEARLQSYDFVVLGGLDEGVWPDLPTTDPWLSRPMRREMGLAAPERRIGLMAHDMAQALAAAPNVLMTRAAKRGGAPTVASRWLLRLEAVLDGTGAPDALVRTGTDHRAVARQLDAADPVPLPPPAPRPPVALRPRRLSVTRIETWIRDPYAIYARHILDLRPLDPIDAAPDAAERGTMIHAILADFLARPLTGDVEADTARLIALGRAAFARHADRPAVGAIWWPRFCRVAGEFVAIETERRQEVVGSFTEVDGSLQIDAPAGPFVLTARADRIDLLDTGLVRIVDYKTGAPPSGKQVREGFAPQLPLEAAILVAGGFEGLPPDARSVGMLEYMQLSGGTPAVAGRALTETDLKTGLDAAAGEARDKLAALVAAFDDPDQPYRPLVAREKRRYLGDYEHLARVREWGVGVEEGEA